MFITIFSLLVAYGIFLVLRMNYLARKGDSDRIFDGKIGIFGLLVSMLVTPVISRYWIYRMREQKNGQYEAIFCLYEATLWAFIIGIFVATLRYEKFGEKLFGEKIILIPFFFYGAFSILQFLGIWNCKQTEKKKDGV